MTREEIEAWLSEHLEELGLLQPTQIMSPKMDLVNDLGFDSLDIIELHMEAEEEFNIVVMDDEIDTIRTVNDLVNFIETKLKEKENQP